MKSYQSYAIFVMNEDLLYVHPDITADNTLPLKWADHDIVFLLVHFITAFCDSALLGLKHMPHNCKNIYVYSLFVISDSPDENRCVLINHTC